MEEQPKYEFKRIDWEMTTVPDNRFDDWEMTTVPDNRFEKLRYIPQEPTLRELGLERTLREVEEILAAANRPEESERFYRETLARALARIHLMLPRAGALASYLDDAAEGSSAEAQDGAE